MEIDESGGGVWDQRNTVVFCDIPVSTAPSPTHGKVTFMIRVAALVGGVHIGTLRLQSFFFFFTLPSFRNIFFYTDPLGGTEVKTLVLELGCAEKGVLGEFK